ncbi:MAG: TetR/AcrR family transcriptional regulator [Candidatus Neomarinimicrobiota bacterium]|nr:TetR/AcrR family transcriptional regulator [Candidatus Neomarinimicrobiota bacterium]MEC9273388.1 TetR/AcrR family transcriptional regulator [Candidatus Neomarinimicrobiota bacterium]
MNTRKQDLRKNQILDAAMEVITQNGYENSRMDDVVKLSNMSKGAIYWYYKSKKDLYLDLVNYWVMRYSDMVAKIMEKDQKASIQLKQILNYFIDEYEKDPEPFKALTEFWSMAQKDDDFHKKVQKVYAAFLEVIESIITNGKNSGEFKNVNTRIAALSIMINIETINWFTLFDDHGVSAREYFNTLRDFILAGLLKKI